MTVLRVISSLVLIAFVVLIAVVIGIPDAASLRRHVDAVGVAGPVVFAVVYGLCCLSPLPKTVLTLLAGTVFGVALGVPVVIAGGTLGAVLAHLIGKALGRETVLALTGRRFEALDQLMSRRGFVAVLTARLVPIIPFTAVNYLSGVTALRIRHLVTGTVIGMIPATTAYVVMGSYGSEPGSWPFLTATGALLLLSAVGLYLARVRRRRARAVLTAAAGTGVTAGDA